MRLIDDEDRIYQVIEDRYGAIGVAAVELFKAIDRELWNDDDDQCMRLNAVLPGLCDEE